MVKPMANERRTVQVFADWESLGGPRLMGRLHSTPSRGKAVFSFEYESAWLQSGEAQRMDPKLDLFSGPQYPTSGHDNFGVFLDSCPDRWGRTLLERRDGEEASYLDLAEVLLRQGAHPARDLAQLWRRIVFFVCVSNVDDHLRNHGFLLEKNGWSLSPAYDINPVVGGSRALNISATDNAQDLELVREVAKYFRVEKKAKDIVSEVKAAVRTWRAEAEAAGIARSEQARMAPAFELADE